jgi:O-acetylserine/cysteine efflux transporter
VQVFYRRPLSALVVAAALWGGAVTGTKYALRGFDPTTLLSVELTAATGALWAVLLVRGYRPPQTWRLPVLLGLLEPALAYMGDTSGLSRTTAVDGSVLSGLEPALVIVLAALLLGETVTRPVVVAVVLALGGLAVLTGAGHSRSASIGDLYVAGGILSAGLYTIVAKRFDDGSDTLSLTTWQFSAASTLLLPIALARWSTGSGHPLVTPSPKYWVAAVGVGIGGFAMSFLLYNAVITSVDAGWAAVVLNLIPVFGLLSAVVFLGENPTATTGIGAILIGVSVIYFTICDRRGASGAVIPPMNHSTSASPPMDRNRRRTRSART